MAPKMTSAARTTDFHPGGFTLLEMVVVLLVVALLGGGAVAMLISSADERALNRSSVEVEVLAKRARTLASLQQRPYALEFSNNGVSLMPLAEAILEPAEREKAAEAQEKAAEAAADKASANSTETAPVVSSFESKHANWTLDGDMRLFVRRWASDVWIPIDAKHREVWRFDPEGFCEPVGVRVEIGKSWKESEFHPLTGGIRDSSMEAY